MMIEAYVSKKLLLTLMVLISTTLVFGHANYTGYSGAPGTTGRCASQCHGSNGGTITVSGFPSNYVPGQYYIIKIKHTSGSKISNFNASIRVGTTSTTAGTITAGLNSATYNISFEPNGVHLASNNQDSCIFTWRAPSPGVGNVTFYLGGLQGTTVSGQNTNITLTANQGQGIHDVETDLMMKLSLQINPSIASKSFDIALTKPDAKSAQIKILQTNGKIVNKIQIPASIIIHQTIIFKTIDNNGRQLPNGTYIAAVICGKEQIIKKFIIQN
jgi:hypothetical protein